eukprot:4749107-Amphidinium_carterae.1
MARSAMRQVRPTTHADELRNHQPFVVFTTPDTTQANAVRCKWSRLRHMIVGTIISPGGRVLPLGNLSMPE